MLVDPYYIIPFHLLGQMPEADNQSILAVKLPLSSTALRECYKKFSENSPAQPFCLYLEVHGPWESSAMNDLAAFFFLPHYIRRVGAPLVLYRAAGSELLKAFKAAISQVLEGQGFDAPPAGYTDYGQVNDNELLNLADRDRMAAAYQDALYALPAMKRIFVLISDKGDIDLANQLFAEAEKRLEREAAIVFKMHAELEVLRKLVEELRAANRAAELEIRHLNSHMEILRSNAQATHLQHYYDREYEALPLWYKRFGHVLKAVTGKRTLRSLFDKNVKKYKT